MIIEDYIGVCEQCDTDMHTHVRMPNTKAPETAIGKTVLRTGCPCCGEYVELALNSRTEVLDDEN